jgi:hypothetical protein
MSSRGKKKKLWKEEKERRYQNLKQGYDTIIDNLEKMKQGKLEGKTLEEIFKEG